MGKGAGCFLSIALVVVWTAVNLTSYNDCLISFHEPFSPHCKHHFEEKNFGGGGGRGVCVCVCVGGGAAEGEQL